MKILSSIVFYLLTICGIGIAAWLWTTENTKFSDQTARRNFSLLKNGMEMQRVKETIGVPFVTVAWTVDPVLCPLVGTASGSRHKVISFAEVKEYSHKEGHFVLALYSCPIIDGFGSWRYEVSFKHGVVNNIGSVWLSE